MAVTPMPELPQIPKGSPTPAAIIGILSVPDVLRVSTAYQAADDRNAVSSNPSSVSSAYWSRIM